MSLYLAFPHNKHGPSFFLKSFVMLLVASNVSLEFLPPVLLPRLRHGCPFAPGMTMPEAAMNEYHGVVFWHDNVWLSREVSSMQRKAESASVQKGPNDQLGLGVSCFNAAHEPPTSFFRKPVRHMQTIPHATLMTTQLPLNFHLNCETAS